MSEIVMVGRTGRTQVCIESTFGTFGTGTDVYAESGIFFEMKRKELPIKDERPRKFTHQKAVHGPKTWSGKLTFNLKPDGTQLNAAATPATPPQGILAKALLGGESYGAGSTIASAASGSSITVASGHGSRFSVGQWIAVGVSDVLYPTKVISVSTDTLGLYPALPGTPASGQLVINGYNYYPTQSNVQTLGIRHAKINAANLSDDAQQWEFTGGTGDLSLKLAMGEIAQMECDLRGVQWSGPSNAPGLLPAPTASDTMGAPWVVNEATGLWQPIATTTRVHKPFRKLDVKLNGGMVHLAEFGGVNGFTGVERVGGDYLFASAEIVKLYDSTFEGYYEGQDSLFFAVILTYGSGTTKRFCVVELPTTYHLEKPLPQNDSDVVVLKHMLEALEDATISSPSTDLGRAPMRMAWI